jgi:hypothetical protein
MDRKFGLFRRIRCSFTTTPRRRGRSDSEAVRRRLCVDREAVRHLCALDLKAGSALPHRVDLPKVKNLSAEVAGTEGSLQGRRCQGQPRGHGKVLFELAVAIRLPLPGTRVLRQYPHALGQRATALGGPQPGEVAALLCPKFIPHGDCCSLQVRPPPSFAPNLFPVVIVVHCRCARCLLAAMRRMWWCRWAD